MDASSELDGLLALDWAPLRALLARLLAAQQQHGQEVAALHAQLRDIAAAATASTSAAEARAVAAAAAAAEASSSAAEARAVVAAVAAAEASSSAAEARAVAAATEAATALRAGMAQLRGELVASVAQQQPQPQRPAATDPELAVLAARLGALEAATQRGVAEPPLSAPRAAAGGSDASVTAPLAERARSTGSAPALLVESPSLAAPPPAAAPSSESAAGDPSSDAAAAAAAAGGRASIPGRDAGGGRGGGGGTGPSAAAAASGDSAHSLPAAAGAAPAPALAASHGSASQPCASQLQLDGMGARLAAAELELACLRAQWGEAAQWRSAQQQQQQQQQLQQQSLRPVQLVTAPHLELLSAGCSHVVSGGLVAHEGGATAPGEPAHAASGGRLERLPSRRSKLGEPSAGVAPSLSSSGGGGGGGSDDTLPPPPSPPVAAAGEAALVAVRSQLAVTQAAVGDVRQGLAELRTELAELQLAGMHAGARRSRGLGEEAAPSVEPVAAAVAAALAAVQSQLRCGWERPPPTAPAEPPQLMPPVGTGNPCCQEGAGALPQQQRGSGDLPPPPPASLHACFPNGSQHAACFTGRQLLTALKCLACDRELDAGVDPRRGPFVADAGVLLPTHAPLTSEGCCCQSQAPQQRRQRSASARSRQPLPAAATVSAGAAGGGERDGGAGALMPRPATACASGGGGAGEARGRRGGPARALVGDRLWYSSTRRLGGTAHGRGAHDAAAAASIAATLVEQPLPVPLEADAALWAGGGGSGGVLTVSGHAISRS